MRGSSSNWREEVRLRISQEADGVWRRPPPCFRRLDGFKNEYHPSIFNRRRHKPASHVAIDVVSTSLPHQQLPASGQSNTAAQELIVSGGGGQLEAAAAGRDPVVAAVGPYCHQRLWPPPLVTHANKCGIVMFLADRFGLDTADFLGWALSKEAQARRCYEQDSFAMGPEEVAEMLLLDGCLLLFALFLLRRSAPGEQRPSDVSRNQTYGTEFIYLSATISLHMKQTRLDLLMLDNQFPFFVLAELHTRLKGSLFGKTSRSIEQLALSCFDDIHPACCFRWPGPPPREPDNNVVVVVVVHHLLHLFHWSRVPPGKHMVDISSILPRESEPHLPCVAELKESLKRVVLQKKRSQAAGSLGISFQREMQGMCAVMTMPALCIHNYSDCVFRSLIAFEQNHLRCGLPVTAYSICMAWLLRSEADVQVLRNKGILVHTQKTDREIVDFFRGLRDEYADTCLPQDLIALCTQVAAHQRSRPAAVVKRVGRQCFPRQSGRRSPSLSLSAL